ncbi:MAG TPA: response regulator, partial [Thiothrix sp.]|nr:response regulator [Thiothrix sp.]
VIEHVVDGKKVVEEVKKKRYTLILMDIHMPDVDGYVATKLIRKWEKENNIERIPIIAMTANALKGDREKCLDMGMDDYLAKPVSRDKLLEKVKVWMKKVQKEKEACPV